MQHVERSLVLQEEEILRICRVMAELGIRKIKLTGGEPLVRPRMPKLVEKLKNMPGIEKVTLTTNGVLLKDQMRDFARAGLDGLNISLDTLDNRKSNLRICTHQQNSTAAVQQYLGSIRRQLLCASRKISCAY